MPAALSSLTVVFSLLLLLSPRAAVAQDITDTIFYDARWSICERTPATYYRTGTLRIDSVARYIGLAQDFYMNGQPEMKARYNEMGDLHGEVVFYHPNGKVKTTGAFRNGDMAGKWSHFDSTGQLRAVFNCTNERTFTPLFLRNKRGKVILQDGNGRFHFQTNDFSDIISPSGYEIAGEVRNGQKEGTWKYTAMITVWAPQRTSHMRRTVVSETYVHDKFMRALGNPDNNVKERKVLNTPFQYFSLYPRKLESIQRLHSDFIFARTRDGRYQLRAFLVARRPPLIEEAPASPDQNFSLFMRIIANALMKKEALSDYRYMPPGRNFSDDSHEILRMTSFPKNIPRYDARILFSILPNGSIGELQISGKIDQQLKEIITYYFSRVRNLYYTGNPLDDKIELNLKTSFQNSNTLFRGSIVLSRM